MLCNFPNFRSFSGTRRCEESPLADLAGESPAPQTQLLRLLEKFQSNF